MKRIAVGVDGSAASAAALRWASSLAEAVGAEMVAVGATPGTRGSELPEANQEHRIADREAAMTTWMTEAGLDPEPVALAVDIGDPREVLPAAAEAAGADLLVLGRSGAGGRPGFLHLGSVVEHIAHHVAFPLAIVPADWSGKTRRLVLGVDGSETSLRAVDWVTGVAPALGATVLAVQVEEPFLEWTPADSPDNWRRDVERDIEGWTADLVAAGAEVTAIAKRDLQPADALVGVVSARYADLLVIGSRGVGGFAGLRIGGVAMKVLHRIGVPMVLVPSD